MFLYVKSMYIKIKQILWMQMLLANKVKDKSKVGMMKERGHSTITGNQ